MDAPAIEVEAAQAGGLETAKDLLSGAVGGIAQVLIGMLHMYWVAFCGKEASASIACCVVP